jgi:bifunctional polynucleotide phosphatase/kinase
VTGKTPGFSETLLTVFRDFAANIGITYFSPEEYFLDEKPRPFNRLFDPSLYVGEDYLKDKQSSEVTPFEKKHELDIIIFCGSPGAGKSTFYWNYLKPLGYERVNQDILKSVGIYELS